MLRHVVPTDLYNYDENTAPEGPGRTGRKSGRRFCQAGREAAGRDRRPFATSDDLPSPGGMTWASEHSVSVPLSAQCDLVRLWRERSDCRVVLLRLGLQRECSAFRVVRPRPAVA
ncbi:hypothetical protein Areg01_17810 [Actinoplanes regularis]|nr:hypothetical protein Areg01_17810 [Actinoplanes regularis]